MGGDPWLPVNEVVLPELVWVSIVYLLLHDFEFQILKVSKAIAALDDSPLLVRG